MLTLEQLIDLGNNINIDIFKGLQLPEGSPLDRDTLINSIIMRCGLNIPMYADPFVFSSAVTVWSAKNQYTFIHVGKIFNADYSPIENKNYFTEHITERSRDLKDNTENINTKSENTETAGHTEVTEGKTSEHTGNDVTTELDDTSAYNASDYQEKDKIETTLEHGETITDNGEGTTESTGSVSKDINGSSNLNKNVDEKENIKETMHEHGNIGLTTNTQMQTEEYEMLKDLRPYDFLAELFENELTLFVY